MTFPIRSNDEWKLIWKKKRAKERLIARQRELLRKIRTKRGLTKADFKDELRKVINLCNKTEVEIHPYIQEYVVQSVMES